jgi:hypothetical protein
MMKTTTIAIEFIGGPFDGHMQSVSATPDELLPSVALPVNENVLRMLDGQARGPARPTRTVAFYELQHDNGWRYCFVQSKRAAEFDLEGWLV